MTKVHEPDYSIIYHLLKSLLSCCFVLLSSPLFSQIQTKPIKSGAAVKMVLRKEIAAPVPSISFGGLVILDSRNDTTSIGYSPGKNAKLYTFKKGFITELADWYTSYLDIKPGNIYAPKLLVNIKKLRISDEATTKVLENGTRGQPHNGWEKGVIIKIEYFIQKDSFFTPLYRYDSIIPLKGGVERHGEAFISIGLKSSLEQLCNMSRERVLLTGKKISMSDILVVNRQGFDLPVYTDTTLKRGVYKTFRDFKMNTISWPDFVFKEGKMADVLYVQENGTESSLRFAWGYCDGKNYFINSGDKYSMLIRSGYNFYFAGIKGVFKGTKHMMLLSSGMNYATDTGPKNNVYEVDVNYYQLDMENGNVY